MTAIEVRVLETGDNAYALDPEAALLAARTLGREAREAMGLRSFDPTLVFEVDGKIVRSAKLRALTRTH